MTPTRKIESRTRDENVAFYRRAVAAVGAERAVDLRAAVERYVAQDVFDTHRPTHARGALRTLSFLDAELGAREADRILAD